MSAVKAWFERRGADVTRLTDWTAVGGGGTYRVEGADRMFEVTAAEFAALARAADADERDGLS